jgi:hypothetical protein
LITVDAGQIPDVIADRRQQNHIRQPARPDRADFFSRRAFEPLTVAERRTPSGGLALLFNVISRNEAA